MAYCGSTGWMFLETRSDDTIPTRDVSQKCARGDFGEPRFDSSYRLLPWGE
jgi:hypothetical protein